MYGKEGLRSIKITIEAQQQIPYWLCLLQVWIECDIRKLIREELEEDVRKDGGGDDDDPWRRLCGRWRVLHVRSLRAAQGS